MNIRQDNLLGRGWQAEHSQCLPTFAGSNLGHLYKEGEPDHRKWSSLVGGGSRLGEELATAWILVRREATQCFNFLGGFYAISWRVWAQASSLLPVSGSLACVFFPLFVFRFCRFLLCTWIFQVAGLLVVSRRVQGGSRERLLATWTMTASSSTDSASFPLTGQWAPAASCNQGWLKVHYNLWNHIFRYEKISSWYAFQESWLYFLQVRAPALIAGSQASFCLFPGIFSW